MRQDCRSILGIPGAATALARDVEQHRQSLRSLCASPRTAAQGGRSGQHRARPRHDLHLLRLVPGRHQGGSRIVSAADDHGCAWQPGRRCSLCLGAGDRGRAPEPLASARIPVDRHTYPRTRRRHRHHRSTDGGLGRGRRAVGDDPAPLRLPRLCPLSRATRASSTVRSRPWFRRHRAAASPRIRTRSARRVADRREPRRLGVGCSAGTSIAFAGGPAPDRRTGVAWG